jgi:nucleoside-diphosphate-sugar epimerase
MRVAVLGASGFIGSRLVERLHLTGAAEVRPVVRAAARLAGPARFALDGRVADARDRRALAEALGGCDAVVHAVAGDHATIVDAAEAAYRAAADAGVKRLVYLSTASVHGQAPAMGTDERSPLSRRQPITYNRSKIDAENLLRGLRRSGPVELVLLRPGIVYGPRSYWTGGLADELLSGEAYLVEGGAGICNAIYVDNLAQAIELALSAPGIDGEAFLLGEEETVTWRDLYRPVVEALGLSMEEVPSLSYDGRRDWAEEARRATDRLPPLARRALAKAYRAMQSRSSTRSPFLRPAAPLPKPTLERALLHRCGTKLPWTKARDRLGYRPRVSFEEGCRRSVAWLDFAGYPVTGR